MYSIKNLKLKLLIKNDWKKILESEFNKKYFIELENFLDRELAEKKEIYPPVKDLFNVFKFTNFKNLKVVILGQDPYHGKGQANGLCFSVAQDVKIPPSLKNIFKELNNDLKISIPSHGDLSSWAEQGVLLLNTCLSVESGLAGSHQNIGWEHFSDRIIKMIDQKKENVVFILWGKPAQNKACFVDAKRHLILKSPHPSPLSAYRGFFNNHHFSKSNQYLKSNGKDEINWSLA